MQTIDINTTQNVVIRYELATLGERIFAFIIDILIICSLVAMSFLFIIQPLGLSSNYAFVLLILPVLLFYSLFLEIFNDGQSFGKMALSIKVVKISGKEAGIGDYLLRWVFRSVDIYLSFGSVASLFISSSKGQRLGDVLANTTVVKLQPRLDLKLKDIMDIKTLSSYKPVYPEVKHLREDDMLLVKKVIDEYKKYPNRSHQQSVVQMSEKVEQFLNIKKQKQETHINFLRTLINDYIVLTR